MTVDREKQAAAVEHAVRDGVGNPQVSVVIPVYEEHETIERLLVSIMETLAGEGISFEVVAVDDGSSDQTLEVLRKVLADHPEHLRIARHLYNKGNGASLRTGIQVAKGDIVVSMDADGQHRPDEIMKLVRLIPPYDLVVGARTESYQSEWHRDAANRFYNAFASWLSHRKIDDLTSGFRAMRRTVARHFLPLFPDGFSAPTTTTLSFLKAGYNVAFVPVSVQPRQGGKSKIRLWTDGSHFILLILRIVMLYDPLRIFLLTSVLLASAGVLLAAAGILRAGRLVISNSAILLLIAAFLSWLLGMVSSLLSNSLVHYQGDETILVETHEDLPSFGQTSPPAGS